MPEAIPLPPPEEDTKKNDNTAEADDDSESDEEPSSSHLHNIKAEIEELAVIAMHCNVRNMKGFPDHVLHTDCGKEMLTTVSAQYLLAEKQRKNPVDALRRALQAISEDKGHILSNLFADYAARSNALMKDARIWKSPSTVETANILMRQKDGTVDTRTIFRSAVERLCKAMADVLGDHTYDFEKRVAMRETVTVAHTAFGKELTRLVLPEEGGEGDA